MLQSIIAERPHPSGKGWQTRVVPNKYPALTTLGDNRRYHVGFYLAMRGYGNHEVIVESRRHDRHGALMSVPEVETIVHTYHERYRALMEDHENMMIIIFRNHGARAGTSLIHPHSQLIVTGIVPNFIRWREEQAQRYFDTWGRCVFCDMLQSERADRRRLVFENESFLAFVPFAAEVPFETWLMPKRHQADFGQISDREKSDLAAGLHHILKGLYDKLNDPDYNYVINTAPRYKADEPQLHWYLQVRPRLTTRAGFEIGSGISINPSLPEADAEFMRE
jgi:UDPglucose--hexose-1-phosphate uridylyltransferase